MTATPDQPLLDAEARAIAEQRDTNQKADLTPP